MLTDIRALADHFLIALPNINNVLTPIFGHVSFDTHLEIMERGPADGAMVTSLQGSCR